MQVFFNLFCVKTIDQSDKGFDLNDNKSILYFVAYIKHVRQSAFFWTHSVCFKSQVKPEIYDFTCMDQMTCSPRLIPWSVGQQVTLYRPDGM